MSRERCPQCLQTKWTVLCLGPSKYLCLNCNFRWGESEEWNPSERDRPVGKIDYNCAIGENKA